MFYIHFVTSDIIFNLKILSYEYVNHIVKFHWRNLFIWTNVADVFDTRISEDSYESGRIMEKLEYFQV